MGPVAGAFVLKRLHDFDDAIFFFLLIQVATVMVSVAGSSIAFALAANGWLQGSVSLGALGVFVGFLVAGLFEWNFGDHEIMTLVWATVGLSLASGRLSLS